MAVGRDYMLEKPHGPSSAKVYFDTRAVPFAANAAHWFELALDRASVRTGIRPAVILAGTTGVLSFLLFRLTRRPRTPNGMMVR